MSEAKNPNGGMVISEPVLRHREKLLKHWRLIAIAIVALAIIAGVAWWAHDYFHKPTPKEITKLESTGDYGKAADSTQKAISQTSSSTQKSTLYTQLASEYANGNKPDQAIQAYQQAASLTGMTANIAYNIGSLYFDEKNNAQAIVYFQKAIDLWPKDDPLHDAEVRSLQQTIKGLQ
jgi:tetratricopeptide (TPR) repeat protein